MHIPSALLHAGAHHHHFDFCCAVVNFGFVNALSKQSFWAKLPPPQFLFFYFFENFLSNNQWILHLLTACFHKACCSHWKRKWEWNVLVLGCYFKLCILIKIGRVHCGFNRCGGCENSFSILKAYHQKNTKTFSPHGFDSVAHTKVLHVSIYVYTIYSVSLFALLLFCQHLQEFSTRNLWPRCTDKLWFHDHITSFFFLIPAQLKKFCLPFLFICRSILVFNIYSFVAGSCPAYSPWSNVN